jgi:hypothetical protein
MAREIRVGDEVTSVWWTNYDNGSNLGGRGQTMARCDWVENGKAKGGSVSITSLKHANE